MMIRAIRAAVEFATVGNDVVLSTFTLACNFVLNGLDDVGSGVVRIHELTSFLEMF